jgi:uncharacterized protein YbbK (DUF523 family)
MGKTDGKIKKIFMKLCSACLLGIRCRYDGGDKANEKVLALAKEEILLPVCPEQLGGLSTPREPAEQRGEKVFTKSGYDVTENFFRGADEVLRLCKMYNIKEVILKQKSPSCGCGKIFDGTFSNQIIAGDGVTTKLLKENGIKVISEEDL